MIRQMHEEPPSSRTILLVEDDDLTLKSLSMVITSLGHTVVPASCAEEALEAAHEQHIHLLMTDFHLPGINGVDLATQLRKEGHRVPVILISGYLNDSVQEKARSARINVMLPKPPDLKTLEHTLTHLLHEAHA